jgi:hypothetical protein
MGKLSNKKIIRERKINSGRIKDVREVHRKSAERNC